MARAPRALTQEALSHIARVRDKLAAYGVERQRDDQWRYIEECLLAMPDARRSLSVADLDAELILTLDEPVHPDLGTTVRLAKTQLGQVYLAWDNSLGKFVVVKSTCFSKWKRSIWMENPWREIHMLRLLRRLGAHPNICHSELVNAHGWWRVHPSWERGNNVMCHAMTWCEGGDMLDFIAAREVMSTPLSEAVVVHWFRQLVAAVCHLHSCGIVHLDVSLENVLFLQPWARGARLSTDSEQLASTLKLSDLGLARFCAPGTVLPYWPGGLGKAGYVSPEMASAATPFRPHLADSYALGIVLFTLLTGQAPYDQTKEHGGPRREVPYFADIVSGHLTRVLRVRGLVERVPPAACQLLQQLLCAEAERMPAERVLEHPWLRPLEVPWPLATSPSRATAKQLQPRHSSGQLKSAVCGLHPAEPTGAGGQKDAEASMQAEGEGGGGEEDEGDELKAADVTHTAPSATEEPSTSSPSLAADGGKASRWSLLSTALTAFSITSHASEHSAASGDERST